jgi:hypothetical protein
LTERFSPSVTDMVKLLRTLLIACAVAAPVVGGLPATGPAAAFAVWAAAAPSPFDEHREDDAGTAVEQAEEDDTEEEVFRDLLLATDDAGGHAADRFRQGVGVPADNAAAASCRLGHSSRGPPVCG